MNRMNVAAKMAGREVPYEFLEKAFARAAEIPREEFGFIRRVEQPAAGAEDTLERLFPENAAAVLVEDATAEALAADLGSSAHAPYAIIYVHILCFSSSVRPHA